MQSVTNPDSFIPRRGCSVTDFHLRWTRNDHAVIRFCGRFFVADIWHSKHEGGRKLHAQIQSEAFEDFDDAVDRVNSMIDSKAAACERWGCE